MKFGKEFKIYLEETLPSWRDKYLCYKLLKQLLKNIPADDYASNSQTPIGYYTTSFPTLQHWFVMILIDELEKFNDFYVGKEKEFILRFEALKERLALVKQRRNRDGVFSSETEFSEEMMQICRDFVAIHGEMILLKHYSSLNLTGLIKILKKYDKRTGGLMQLPFIRLALQQPFFTIEPLTQLVIECEANIDILFPVKGEVVEFASDECDEGDLDISQETAPSVEDEAVGIRRSVDAALRAIEGLKKSSSTNNPLSYSSLYGSQGDGAMGALTTENSLFESSGCLDDEVDSGEDVVDSPK